MPSPAPLTTAEVLRLAKAKIADHSHWTTRVFARSAEATTVRPTDPKACQWCATGAVWAIEGKSLPHYSALHALRCALPGKHSVSIEAFNDSAAHAEVLALFDKAIEIAEGWQEAKT